MEEEYLSKKKVDSTKLAMKEIGFTVVAILFVVQYYKILAYAYDRWIWGTGVSDHFFYLLLLFVVLPASYFSTKYLVKVIKFYLN